jgi:hypothetical protein
LINYYIEEENVKLNFIKCFLIIKFNNLWELDLVQHKCLNKKIHLDQVVMISWVFLHLNKLDLRQYCQQFNSLISFKSKNNFKKCKKSFKKYRKKLINLILLKKIWVPSILRIVRSVNTLKLIKTTKNHNWNWNQ